MPDIVFEKGAWEDVSWWIKNNPKTVKRLFELIDTICKTPFDGIGKPEPLKGNYKGYWSRRITEEDRLVYKIFQEKIIIVLAKGHY